MTKFRPGIDHGYTLIHLTWRDRIVVWRALWHNGFRPRILTWFPLAAGIVFCSAIVSNILRMLETHSSRDQSIVGALQVTPDEKVFQFTLGCEIALWLLALLIMV